MKVTFLALCLFVSTFVCADETRVSYDFEQQKTGEKPNGWTSWGHFNAGDLFAVSDDLAFSGNRSLLFERRNSGADDGLAIRTSLPAVNGQTAVLRFSFLVDSAQGDFTIELRNPKRRCFYVMFRGDRIVLDNGEGRRKDLPLALNKWATLTLYFPAGDIQKYFAYAVLDTHPDANDGENHKVEKCVVGIPELQAPLNQFFLLMSKNSVGGIHLDDFEYYEDVGFDPARAFPGSPFAKDVAQPSTAKMDVYLCIGQSNMAGRAPIPPADTNVIENCYLLNDDEKWEEARNPLNRYSSIRKDLVLQRLGPAYLFAKTMMEDGESNSIGLIVNACGGTSINSWTNGTLFYKHAVRRTRIAMQSGTLKGVIWHQGESDKDDAEWLGKLETLIGDLRREFDDPTLPFVAGEVNDVELINEQVWRLPGEVMGTGVVSANGLKAMDRWHFDASSVKELGRRYAEQMKVLQDSLGKGIEAEE